jgi:glycosyltransferase involved in cell wall biosynthesis
MPNDNVTKRVSAMRIAVTHPTRWPIVRRGAERFTEELSKYLLTRGHTAVAVGHDESGLVHRLWQAIPLPKRFQDLTGYDTILPLRRFLLQHRFDVVQSMHFTDGVASVLARGGGHRTCFYVTGPPIPSALRRVPPDRYLVARAIRQADRVLVPSQYVAGIVREFYDLDPMVLPVPIDVEQFRPIAASPAEPATVLGMAAFDDTRKGVRPLVRAFVRLKGRIPELRLVLSGQMRPELQRELGSMLPPGFAADVEFAGVGELKDLPLLYNRASVLVVPSKWESYSLVALEAWACGCPVVAAAHGALPELVNDPRIGRLFAPGEDGVEVNDIAALENAIEAGLELRRGRDTARHCREKAERYSWTLLGPAFENVYASLCGR